MIVLMPKEDLPAAAGYDELLLDAVGCRLISRIQRNPLGPPGRCYWNVRDIVQQHGGELSLGWFVSWLPGRYIYAMHHGVWKSPEGNFIDVTRPLEEPPAGITTFVHESRKRDINLKFPPGIRPKFIQLDPNPLITEMIDTFFSNWEYNQKAHDIVIESENYTWSPDSGYAGPPYPPDAVALWKETSRTFAELSELRRRVSEYHLA